MFVSGVGKIDKGEKSRHLLKDCACQLVGTVTCSFQFLATNRYVLRMMA